MGWSIPDYYDIKYDSSKKYMRIGDCNHCGRCCDLYCDHLIVVANRDIRKGEKFYDTGDTAPIMFLCDIFKQDDLPIQCKDFPSSPFHTPSKCSFKWVEVT